MKLEIKRQFDLVYETLGLLNYAMQPLDKEEIIRQLDELGVSGEGFYKKYYRLIERYIKAFNQYRPECKKEHMDFFFGRKESEFFMLLNVLVAENRQWVRAAEIPGDQEIRGLTAFILQDNDQAVTGLADAKWPKLQDEKDMIDFLSAIEMDESLKWHLLEFFQKPKYWMEILLTMIRDNLPACEKALADMEKPLVPFMRDYEKCDDEYFSEIAGICAPGGVVYPTFIFGVSQQVFYSCCYQGIFIDALLKKGGFSSERKELLITRLKALGDKSKLDILCELKHSSKYNLELAEALKLSPSTMSHHMNVLFACGFVGAEKKDGHVCYYLRQDTVEECLEYIRELLI